jgi:SAM-dependent methyltransferase
VLERATEIAKFFEMPVDEAVQLLSKGFHYLHAAVAADFRRADPKNDAELLEWYRSTHAYVWELSAYHLDPGFNYSGMCEGIANHLVALNKESVLCLGDGIGDLSFRLWQAGLDTSYHDLAMSVTAEFAERTIWQRMDDSPAGMDDPDHLSMHFHLTSSWTPEFGRCTNCGGDFREESYDAVVALDFFEHLTDVEAWARAVYRALRPGGQFLAQNAFGIGDNEHEGSIPCHLTRNNRFVADWDPLLVEIGFQRQPSGWWVRP